MMEYVGYVAAGLGGVVVIALIGLFFYGQALHRYSRGDPRDDFYS